MEMEFHFRSFPLRKFSKVPFLFVSVKTNFESSVKIQFPLMALCFRVNPYEAPPSCAQGKWALVVFEEGIVAQLAQV